MSDPKENTSVRDDLIKAMKTLFGDSMLGKAADKLAGRDKKVKKEVDKTQ
jgi:hypothetical protein|tara:strand:- start:25015 stop:25164 length:150 start_codon:yes stop_codon:yes gene_type:complete